MSKRELLMTLCYYTSEMACPYFDPQERRTASCDVRDSMLPLGDAWAGVCRAVAGEPAVCSDSDLRPLCNIGYARGNCSRFPAVEGPDAVRFTISRDAGNSVGIYYVVERDHHPFAHGPLEYSTVSGAVSGAPGELLARQAAAYIESYRRRRTA